MQHPAESAAAPARPERNPVFQLAREDAHSLNPLISAFSTPDTLQQLSSLVRDIGYFVSIFDNEVDGRLGSIYLLCEPIAAALEYESHAPK